MRARFFALVLASLAVSWAEVAVAEPSGASTPRTAVVVFRADHADAVLESDWAPDDKPSPWYVLCVAPCQQKVVADARLRVSGPGMYSSRTFKLPLERDRVSVTAAMESRSVAGGAALLALGYALLGVTGPTLVISGLARRHGGTELVATGIGIGVAGAVVGTFGLVLMFRKAQYKESRVKLAEGSRPRLVLPGGFALEPRGLTF